MSLVDDRVFEYYPRLGAVRDHVLLNADRLIGLTEAASVANCSPNSFSRDFRKRTGVCYKRWMHSVRISHAAGLLTTRRYSILEVAHGLGYNELSTFYDAFERLVGLTPGEWQDGHAPRPNALMMLVDAEMAVTHEGEKTPKKRGRTRKESR